MDGLETRLAAVRAGVRDAARAAGRDPGSIRMIVVTKFHPAQLVRRLVELGVHDFGESRHQEAQPKIQQLAELDLTWHFIGQLQRKKAKAVAAYSDVIHSVDRESLVTALESSARTIDAFIQVNLTADPDRGGVPLAELEPLATRVLAADRINLLGVMAVAPLGEEPRRAFARLRAASERVRRLSATSDAISAGMSQDYPQAIAEGATHLRIGSAITGNRPPGR
ncbi:MAG: YggS family pyridoxal phosphate-dependent enzyme [Microbacteriaceae bacterium]